MSILKQISFLQIAGSVEAGKKQVKHDFSFDQVFPPNSMQSEIFESVSPLIQSALDGYNVCIFAYGQTGKCFNPINSFDLLLIQ